LGTADRENQNQRSLSKGGLLAAWDFLLSISPVNTAQQKHQKTKGMV
jgi:hypothetical protein